MSFEKIEKEIQRAKIALLLKERFFGDLLTYLPIEENKAIETFETDGKEIIYSPAFAKGLTRSEIMAVLAHEVCHCLFNHHTERKGRNPKTWNDAGDYMINLILVKSGFNLPGCPLLDRRFENMTTVQIYNILIQEQEQGQGQSQGQEQGQEPVSCGVVNDYPNQDDKAINQEKIIWKQRTACALAGAKLAGNLSAGVARLVKEILDPKVSWQAVLWQFAQESVREDYTFLKPNRKYASTGIFLPSLYNDRIGQIVVAFDCSGSIGPNDINQAASEITEIMAVMRSNITVLYFDEIITETQEFLPGETIELLPKGGGGTNYKPIFEYIEKENIDLACLIVLTDGYCHRYPRTGPDYPVLWVTNRQNWAMPFGEIVNF